MSEQDNRTAEVVCGWPRYRLRNATLHCPGCHYGIIQRLVCEALEEMGVGDRAIFGSVGGGCGAMWILNLDIDCLGIIHGPGQAMASAVKRVHPEAVVICSGGDGEMALGGGYFLAALQRGEKFTTIFLNNGVFGTTGGQMAPTTLLGMRTTTSVNGRDPRSTGFPLHVAELAAGFKGTAYSARVSVHTPARRQQAKKAFKTAIRKQLDGVGYSLVEFLSACPVNWGLEPGECLRFIEEKTIAEFPLGEFKNVDSIDFPAPGAAV